jgi:two-component system, cell cycle sensor histidine kinase and response regulator CckA
MADVPSGAVAQTSEQQPDLRTRLLAQKTLLISELAEAIDNQFNNIMMAITSYAELELKKASPTARRSLEQVVSNAGRATHLVQKLLAFSRTHVTAPRAIDLNEVIEGVRELAHQLTGERIEVALELQSDLPKIKADPVDLEELLLTLAIHARNAMAGSGRLLVSTKSIDVDGATNQHDKLAPGRHVVLSVSDAPAAARAQIADARLTATQDLRISLTLAAINGIVKEANGLIRIASEPEQQTNFTIFFPAVDSDANEEMDTLPEKTMSNAKTILVVEDDDAVRIPATEFLKMEGFKVLQAKTGPEAINIALQKRSPLDLLITDIVMPTMSGREVAKELLEMHSGLKVLYMSGDAGEAPTAGRHGDDVLQKPFRLDKLNQKIRTLLGE